MEAVVEFVTGTNPVVNVPSDLLELIALYTNDAVNQEKLVRTSLQKIIGYSQDVGIPKFFYQQGGDYILGPAPPTGTVVWIAYYRSAATLVNPSDTNWLTNSAPDLLKYAALTMVADTFLDDRAQRWEQIYQQILEAVRVQGQNDELVGASIAPAYRTDQGWDAGYTQVFIQ